MKKDIIVSSGNLLDARVLAEFVALAGKYSSCIFLNMGSCRVNAKSIMGMMGFGLDAGSAVTVEAEGEDAADAIAALEEFLTK